MALVNFNVTPEEGSLFGDIESEEDKGLHAAFVILVTFGVVVVIVSMLVVCLKNRGVSEYEEEQNVYLIAREVSILYSLIKKSP